MIVNGSFTVIGNPVERMNKHTRSLFSSSISFWMIPILSIICPQLHIPVIHPTLTKLCMLTLKKRLPIKNEACATKYNAMETTRKDVKKFNETSLREVKSSEEVTKVL